MKYWEFLIQKEGDETWLPLETQQVEILEGRYRVVAHTDRVNTPMEIRVSQLITQEMPPRLRVRKRRGETNEAGLVVVMPYVHLKPGQWELTCSSLADQASAGDDWRYQVQLQVFAPTEEDWSSEWPIPADAASAQSSLVESPDGAESLAAPSAVQEATPLVQAQAQLQDHLKKQGQGQWSAVDPGPIDLAYSISLQQQAFLARRNQAMTITGQVQSLTDSPQMQGASQLWLRLQNPETAQVIMEAHRPLSLDRLPADFKVKVQLPTNVKTRVVLGEVSLRSASLDGSEPAQILSSTAFTITAGIALLLDDIANKDLGEFDEEEESLLPGQIAGFGAEDSRNRVASNEPDLVSPLLDPTYRKATPAVGVVLPPKLDLNGHSVVEPAYDSDQPELPTFPSARAAQPLTVNDAPASTAPASSDYVEGADYSGASSPTNVTPSDGVVNEPLSGSDLREALPSTPASPAYNSRSPMVSQPAQFMGTSIGDDDLEASQIAALLDDIDGDLASQAPRMDELEPPGIEGALPESQTPHQRGPAQPLSPVAESEAPQPEPAIEPSKVMTRAERQRQERQQRQAEANVAFKSLKLKDHFWQRLSNLTRESHEEATQLSKNMKAAGVSPGFQGAGTPRSFQSDWQNGSPVNNLPANSEVVIYDEPTAAAAPPADAGTDAVQAPSQPFRQPQSRQPGSINQGATTPSLDASSLGTSPLGAPSESFIRQSVPEEDLPEMALPVISVPTGDLVAGDTVTITVRSQPSVYKPFIKLWMIDRQSRTLVGEPKLLTNLKPDALGYLETSTDLRVPMGCLDVQIAAIAVDMATQQESNKAIVNRHVVPSRQSSAGNFSL